MIALALWAALLAAGTSPAPLTLAQYRARLESIESQLQRGERTDAARDAQGLLERSVDSPAGPLAPDRAVLAPIADATSPAHPARLRLLLESLGEAKPERPALAPDKDALERLRAAQTPIVLVKGGSISPLEVDTRPFFETLYNGAAAAGRWVARCWRRFLHWLFDGAQPGDADAAGLAGNANLMIFIATGFVLALVLLLAVRSRMTRRQELPRAAPRGRSDAEADADPLSRTIAEWEQRAMELEQAGRAREAIRAWYHAVLVGCYASGRLSHRRGRTNWEYAADLPPQLAWRPRFFTLTRGFDEQWYGQRESTLEALALFAADAGEILRAVRERAR